MLFAWPLSGWGYGPAPFRLGIWTGPFSVGDMDWPLSSWGYGLALFQLGIWTGPFSGWTGPCFYFHWKKEWNFDGPATVVQ